MKNLHSLILFLSLALVACNEDRAPIEQQPNSKKIVSDIGQSDTTDTLSSPQAEQVQEPIRQIFVIDNCGILLQRDCEPDHTTDKQGIIDSVEQLLGETYYSIGTKGVQPQALDKVYCMEGECGQNQLAISLKIEECNGILIPGSLLGDHPNWYTLDTKDTSYPHHMTSPLDTLMESRVWTDEENTFTLNTIALGYMQENDWPYFTALDWNLVNLKGDTIARKTVKLSTTSPPTPLAILKNTDDIMIFWSQKSGICCPSSSNSWYDSMPQVPIDTFGIQSSPLFPGGFGQPCD